MQAELGERRPVSRYRGLSWRMGKWQVFMHSNHIGVFLGSFVSETEAAAAYDVAALLLRGKEVKLNLPLSNYLDAAGSIIDAHGIKKKLERKGCVAFVL